MDEAKPPPIKIRISSKPSSAPSYSDLGTVSNSQDALKLLLELESKPPSKETQAENVIPALLEYYSKESNSAVRAKIVMMLADFSRTPGYDALPLAEDVLRLLAHEKSHKVMSELVKLLNVIGKALAGCTDLHQQLVKAAKENLDDSGHLVRCECLCLIGSLATSEMNIHEDTQEASTSLVLSVQDLLIITPSEGQKLSLSLYKSACAALKDDYEGVRIAALKLIWTLAHLYPEEMIELPRSGEEKESIRLVDDGFAQICDMVCTIGVIGVKNVLMFLDDGIAQILDMVCTIGMIGDKNVTMILDDGIVQILDMVNDLSVNVRAKAAGLLGSLHSVSVRFLEQTLDKKLMSQLRRKTTAHERQKEKYATGEWSSGQKWGDDAPREDVDPETISCINQGACGAFVHGLEDEFYEVRTAAVDSLCELATQSPSFAVLSLDFLVDMFNDEIEAVRLNAINSLRRISPHIVLREDQLEIVLSVLDDFSKEIREGLHEALCTIHLSTKSCLNRALQFLLRNLNKYPQDRLSIWNCLKHLGSSHPNLTHSLVPELLGTHPFFDTPEPDMDDPAYIAVMILIFNSTVKSPTMVSLFPDYALRHYSYLRDSIPDLVPAVTHISQAHSPARGLSDVGADQDLDTLLQSILSKVKNLEQMEPRSADDLRQLTICDLQRIGELHPRLAASAEYAALYLRCQLLLSKASNSDQMSLPLNLTSQQNEETTLAAVEKVLEMTFKLQHLFIGSSLEEQASIFQARLRAWTLQLIVRLREAMVGGSKKHAPTRLCEEYLKKLQLVQRHFSLHQLKPDSFTRALFSEMHKFDPSKSGILSKFLPSLLLHHPLPALSLSNMICRSKVTILEPAGGSDNPHRFTARLTLSVPLDVMVENVEDIHRIQFMVKFPDSEVQLFNPRLSDFRQLGPMKYRILTEIYLTHGLWSEPCQIDLSVVMMYTPKNLQKTATTNANNTSEKRTIPLCEPVKVFLMPKPPKRL
ncbi:putative integrator complex subunit 4 [Apostichopus japonicus]|uniref:Putative integrator complex subunit 4 n=1 Tax=Stichopus japonicus TaxID=307972 RepID=A0A2G8K8I5_STIJA|nr:putative integrator complex subunit 4 [Apostichopus japonicus]